MRRLNAFCLLLLLALAPLRPTSAQADKTFDARTGMQWYPFVEWRLENASVRGQPLRPRRPRRLRPRRAAARPSRRRCSTTRTTRGPSASPAPAPASGPSAPPAPTGTSTAGPAPSPSTENADSDAHGFMKAFGSKWGWEGTEEAFVPQYVMGKEPSAYLTGGGAVDTAKVAGGRPRVRGGARVHGLPHLREGRRGGSRGRTPTSASTAPWRRSSGACTSEGRRLATSGCGGRGAGVRRARGRWRSQPGR